MCTAPSNHYKRVEVVLVYEPCNAFCTAAEGVARFIHKNNLNALVMIGGCGAHPIRLGPGIHSRRYEGYQTVSMLSANVAKYPALAIPMLCVPASISNSLPGTE